jgi:transcriptional regulator with XRE-family HTH domain
MLTREALAKELDISRPMLSRLEARGMPVDSIERARRWRKKHLQPGRLKGVRRVTGVEDGVQSTAPELGTPELADDDDTEDIDPEDKQIRAFTGARDRREFYLAEMAKLAFEREIGQVMDSAEVLRLLASVGTTIRLSLENMSYRLAPVLAALKSDELQISLLLDKEIFNVLDSMSRQFEKLARQSELPPDQANMQRDDV